LHKRSNGVRAWGEYGCVVRTSYVGTSTIAQNVGTSTIAVLMQNSFDIKEKPIRETKKHCFT
jgi:hypothetical protein